MDKFFWRLFDHSICLGTNIIVWLETKNHNFSVKSFYSFLASMRVELFPYGTIWTLEFLGPWKSWFLCLEAT